mgnify:CR=1 FL=1|tara:strand:+ start:157 stop:831 length:675 start_codon:yes stop_codon:yes gene_type:complete
MERIALIPARGGSKGIPRKNIKLFNEKPLIYWTIKTALESNFLDRVIVSTEDEEIADIARSFSAEVPFMRPASLADDKSQSIDVVLHALQNIPNVSDVLLLQPTSPLRRKYDIDQIFEIRSKFKSDSAVSISLSKENIELYFNIDSANKLYPLNSDLKLAPRQEYGKYYTLNGALYLSTLEFLLKNKSFISSNTIGYVMPSEYSIDIDTQLDWEIAETLMTKLL